MGLFDLFKSKTKEIKPDNPTDIFFYQPTKPNVNCSEIFNISISDCSIRVMNKNINCLYEDLTIESFNNQYNDFSKYLNLLNVKSDSIDLEEINILEQKIITHWIYFYNSNNYSFKIKKEDFHHPSTTKIVIAYLDKKELKAEAKISLGAKIIRMTEAEYLVVIKQSEWYESIRNGTV